MVKAKKETKYIGLPVDSGSFATFYILKNRKTMAFKAFRSKKRAIEAYDMQKLLDEHTMAPKVYGNVRKIDYIGFDGKKNKSGWGYITEIARTINDDDFRDDLNTYDFEDDRRGLVEWMHIELGLDFGDCHSQNVRYVKRGKENVMVCIDTGAESFSGEYAY